MISSPCNARRCELETTLVKTIAMAMVVLMIALPSSAFAQTPQTYILSSALVDEIFQKLARQSYADVAATISKLQAEVQHQPPLAPNTNKKQGP